jgi:hypothetical protein
MRQTWLDWLKAVTLSTPIFDGNTLHIWQQPLVA